MNTKILYMVALMAALAITSLPGLVPSMSAFASRGMSDCNADPTSDDCSKQKDRVGNDDPNDEDADRDGPDEKEDANCWGKVTSDFTTTKDGDGGGDMSHASDPVRGDDDNETPREGVGNQNEGHPSDHGDTVGPLFGSDEECTED